jgi:putative nucleotidyltransferase with HDIG domain
MSSVLFVDEEPRVLEGLENLMFDAADGWDLHFAASGQDALALLRARPIDAVVTEIAMRRMDGAALLQALQADHPGVARIVLSGHAQTAALVRTMPIAHVFLSKPCTALALVDTLEHAVSVHRILTSQALRARLGRVSDLPRRPRLFDEMSRLMATPDVSMVRIAAMVGRDVSLAARTIQLANSALLSRGAKCTRVDHAVARLGAELLRAIVLGHELAASMAGLGPLVEEVNARSMRVAALAARIADPAHADAARLAGVLHDIGRLLLAQLPVDDDPRADPMPDHARAGAYLLGLWGMDYPIIDAVARHHEPLPRIPVALDAATAVRVAAAIVGGRRDHPDPRWAPWCRASEDDREEAA